MKNRLAQLFGGIKNKITAFFNKSQEKRAEKKFLKQMQKSLSKPKTPLHSKPVLPETPIPTQPTKPQESLLNKINDTMEYIQGNPSINRDYDLSIKLRMAMDKLIDDMGHDYKAGEENQYFKISVNWDGTESSLISNVNFKDVGNNPMVEEILTDITESKWGSKELHEEYLQDAKHRSYAKNVEDLDLGLSDNMIDSLENLMNSSEMWHIVGDQYGLGTREYDSKQAKAAWDDMYKSVGGLVATARNKLQGNDLDTLVRMISNGERESTIREYLDKTIVKYTR